MHTTEGVYAKAVRVTTYIQHSLCHILICACVSYSYNEKLRLEIESLRIMLAINTLIIKVSTVNPTPHCTYWVSCTCVCVLFTVHIPLYQNTTLISSLITVAPWVIIFTHVVIYNSISVDFSPPPMLGFYVEYSDCHSNRLQLFLLILWELIAMNTGTVASKHICANYWRCVCKSGRCHTTVKANILT